jgi:hypothetical protein
VSRSVCGSRKLPLNWAIAQSDSHRHLTTLRRMAPENGSQSLTLEQVVLDHLAQDIHPRAGLGGYHRSEDLAHGAAVLWLAGCSPPGRADTCLRRAEPCASGSAPRKPEHCADIMWISTAIRTPTRSARQIWPVAIGARGGSVTSARAGHDRIGNSSNSVTPEKPGIADSAWIAGSPRWSESKSAIAWRSRRSARRWRAQACHRPCVG